MDDFTAARAAVPDRAPENAVAPRQALAGHPCASAQGAALVGQVAPNPVALLKPMPGTVVRGQLTPPDEYQNPAVRYAAQGDPPPPADPPRPHSPRTVQELLTLHPERAVVLLTYP